MIKHKHIISFTLKMNIFKSLPFRKLLFHIKKAFLNAKLKFSLECEKTNFSLNNLMQLFAKMKEKYS